MSQWIICPIRNGLAYTKDALHDFLAQDIKNVEVLWLLNDCQDGSFEWLSWMSRISRQVHVVNVPPPTGVARAWNHGLSWLFGTMDAPYVLVVNNDVRLHEATYRWLVEDGGLFVTAVGTRDADKIKHPIPPDPSAVKRPHPDYSCYLIRREVWDKVGPFDESFAGAYCEDAVHHLAMHRAGITAYCLDVPFLHFACGTIKSAENEEAQAIKEQAEVNRARFKELYGVDVGSKEYYDLFNTTAPPEVDEPTALTAADR